MIRLLITLIAAGLIAGGVYYFLIYDDKTQPAELKDTTGPISNPSGAIDAANEAVEQTQNFQDRLNQRGQEAER